MCDEVRVAVVEKNRCRTPRHKNVAFISYSTGSEDQTAKVWRMSADGTAATCVATLVHRKCVASVAFHDFMQRVHSLQPAAGTEGLGCGSALCSAFVPFISHNSDITA